jgi:uncharacterized protein with ATP-grasp and redox domains
MNSGQSRACPKCSLTLYFTITGNIIDYRHQGAETQCPKLSPKQLDLYLHQPFTELLRGARRVVVSQ